MRSLFLLLVGAACVVGQRTFQNTRFDLPADLPGEDGDFAAQGEAPITTVVKNALKPQKMKAAALNPQPQPQMVQPQPVAAPTFPPMPTLPPHTFPTLPPHPTMAPHTFPTFPPHTFPTFAPHTFGTLPPHTFPTFAPPAATTPAPAPAPAQTLPPMINLPDVRQQVQGQAQIQPQPQQFQGQQQQFQGTAQLQQGQFQQPQQVQPQFQAQQQQGQFQQPQQVQNQPQQQFQAQQQQQFQQGQWQWNGQQWVWYPAQPQQVQPVQQLNTQQQQWQQPQQIQVQPQQAVIQQLPSAPLPQPVAPPPPPPAPQVVIQHPINISPRAIEPPLKEAVPQSVEVPDVPPVSSHVWFKDGFDTSVCRRDLSSIARLFRAKFPANLSNTGKDAALAGLVEARLIECERKRDAGHWDKVDTLISKITLSRSEESECRAGLVQERISCHNLLNYACQFIAPQYNFRLVPARITIQEARQAENGSEKCRKVVRLVKKRLEEQRH